MSTDQSTQNAVRLAGAVHLLEYRLDDFRHIAESTKDEKLTELFEQLVAEMDEAKHLAPSEAPSDPFEKFPAFLDAVNAFAPFSIKLKENEKAKAQAEQVTTGTDEVANGMNLSTLLEEYRKLPVEAQEEARVNDVMDSRASLVEAANDLIAACQKDWFSVDEEAHLVFYKWQVYHKTFAVYLSRAILANRRNAKSAQ